MRGKRRTDEANKTRLLPIRCVVLSVLVFRVDSFGVGIGHVDILALLLGLFGLLVLLGLLLGLFSLLSGRLLFLRLRRLALLLLFLVLLVLLFLLCLVFFFGLLFLVLLLPFLLLVVLLVLLFFLVFFLLGLLHVFDLLRLLNSPVLDVELAIEFLEGGLGLFSLGALPVLVLLVLLLAISAFLLGLLARLHVRSLGLGLDFVQLALGGGFVGSCHGCFVMCPRNSDRFGCLWWKARCRR